MIETLDPVPPYPPAGISQHDGEAYLAWRLNLGEAVPIAAFTYAGGPKEYLRKLILDQHGAMRIMGRGPDGKVETLGALFERIYRVELEPTKKRGKRMQGKVEDIR